jgi:hypothetical protein
MKTVYSVITDSIEEFNKAYRQAYKSYSEVPPIELDFVNATVYQGKVNWDKDLIELLSKESITYLKFVDKANLNLGMIRYLKRRKNSGMTGSNEASLSTKKMILGKIRGLNSDDEKFNLWLRRISPMGVLGKLIKKTTFENERVAPIHISSRYYMQVVGNLIYREQSADTVAMMGMELLTGRRISECNIDNFRKMNVLDTEDRKAITEYYKIFDDRVIDKMDWYWFDGQLKAHRDVGGYPIPTLMRVADSKFQSVGETVKRVVKEYNIKKGLNEDLWGSNLGGVRNYRGKTDSLQKRLLPQLDKAHNIRAIYASIMASCLLESCDHSDTVKLMSSLMGHVDMGSTNKYRIIKVVDQEITPEEKTVLDQYIEIVKDVEGANRDYSMTGRKPSKTFKGWTEAQKLHYRSHYGNEESFDDIKAIAPHDVDLKGFPEKTGKEYKEFYKMLEQIVLEKTGFTYKFLKKRYNNVPFRMIYVAAQELKGSLIDPTKYRLKKDMDLKYSNMSVELNKD